MEGDRDAPLFWPCWVLGTVLLLGLMAYFGVGSDKLASVDGVPYVISLIAAGAEKLPAYAFATGFVPLAVGASLGASSTKRSLLLVLLGTGLMALPVILTILFQGLVGLSQQEPTNGYSRAVPMALYFIAMAPTGFFLICKPIAIGAAAITLVIHLILSLLNELPLPWQRLGGGNDEALYEIGGCVLIATLAIWTFFPTLILGTDPLRDDGATTEEIVAALDPPHADGLWISTPQGRDNMKHWAKQISDDLSKVAAKPCDIRARKSLKYQSNRYFDYIRIYEDWKAGQPLSDISSGAKASIENALNRGFLGWDDLVPATRIHLDREKYQSAARTYPKSCAT